MCRDKLDTLITFSPMNDNRTPDFIYLLALYSMSLQCSSCFRQLEIYLKQRFDISQVPEPSLAPYVCISHSVKQTDSELLSNQHRNKLLWVCHHCHWAHTKSPGSTSLHFVILPSSLINNETLFFLAQQLWKDEAGHAGRWLAGASMNCISWQKECYGIRKVIR